MLSKLMYKSGQPHLSVCGQVFSILFGGSTDLRHHYRADRVCLSLRTKSMLDCSQVNYVNQSKARGLLVGAEELQQISIPAINLVRKPKTAESPDCLTLSEAGICICALKVLAKTRPF